MSIVISFVLAFLLIFFLDKKIKKNAMTFYGLSILLTILVCLYYQFKLYDALPKWVTSYILNPFKRGAFPTALFTLIMYASILDSKWRITKKIMHIRGEIGIIACIITLSHNIVYGFIGKKQHLVKLFTHPSQMETKYFLSATTTVILIVLMLPLMITSFKSVKKRMSYIQWKKIQRLVYPFFILIYVHTMILFIPKMEKKYFEIALYTILLLLYLVLRIRKYYLNKVSKSDKTQFFGQYPQSMQIQ